MNSLIRKSTILFTLLLISPSSFQQLSAQFKEDYKAEIGLQVGGNIYAGDVNTIARKKTFIDNLSNTQMDFGGFLKYKVNTRVAFRLGADYTSVSGDYKYINSANAYTVTLNNTGIIAVDFWGEYNFFEYEKNPYKRYSRTFSPFIYGGLGFMMMPNGIPANNSALDIPVGFGLKVKMGNRWNLIMKWTNHILLADNLEGLKQYDNPIPATKLNFMNNDMLTGLNIGISYDFWNKECNCHSAKTGAASGIRSDKVLNRERPKKKKKIKVRN